MTDEIILRDYQQESIDLAIKDLREDKNPIIALPTGSGKSIVLCGLTDEIINIDINARVLILSHVKEILQQNLSALQRYFYGIDIGLFCSGLNSKTINKITVGSIQTCQNSPAEFNKFTHIIIDEAHRVGTKEESGYRKFIKRIKAQCIGLTATPFRMKDGYLNKGKNSLFNSICIDMTRGERFAKLIEDGYLSEIYSKKTVLTLSDKGVKTLGGDFATKDLSEKFDRDHITEGAIIECIHFGKKYNHWLCFAIDIKHAENIADRARAHGISAIAVHSKMKDRDKAIKDFKNGKYKLMVNVDILTTGFDFPAIDLIIMLRHTKSPIIHVQTTGRGLRPLYSRGYNLLDKIQRLLSIEKSTKTHCLVLDFAGNARRLGPINDVYVKKPGDKKPGDGAMTKTCPECGIDNHLSALFCCNCNFEFVTKEKIETEAFEGELVLKKEEKADSFVGWAEVKSVSYDVYSKSGAKLALIAKYNCGLVTYNEFVFINGKGYSKYKADNWLRFRWRGDNYPKTVEECYASCDLIKSPTKIKIDASGKFPKFLDYRFR